MTSTSCFGPGGISPFNHKKPIDEYDLYVQRKKNISLPKNIQKFFRLLEDIAKIGYSKALKKRNYQQIQNLTINFFKTFDRLSTAEKNHYLLQLIIEADRRIDDRIDDHLEKSLTFETHSLNQTMKDPSKYIESKGRFCFENQKTFGLIKNWNEAILKLNKMKKRLTVKHKNSLFHLPLRSYILRSKKDEMAFALESTHEFEQKNLKTIIFELKGSDKEKYAEFYRNIMDIIVAYQIDKLMMENFFNEKFDKIDDPKRNKIRLYLSETTIKNCRDKIHDFQRKAINQKTYHRIVFKEDHQNKQSIVINEFKNNEGTWYDGNFEIKDRHEPRLINFLEIYHHSHKFLAKFHILETYVQESRFKSEKVLEEEDKKYCAFYQKLKLDDKLYGQEIFLQKIKRKEENEQIFHFVNLDHNFNENFIQFLRITLSPSTSNPQTHFSLNLLTKFHGSFAAGSQTSEEILLQFIKEFYRMLERLRSSHIPEDGQMDIHEINSKFFVEKDLISRFESEESPMDFLKKTAGPSNINMFIKRQSVIDIPEYAYLVKRHRTQPTSQKIGRLMKEHFLYKEWQRLPKGGLKCINYELVAFQKSLYKSVMKKFGQNLFKGKNIINFSLPVVCFKKESHLQSLAQSMCYCPIHLQKAAKIKNPLQKMKYSVVIMIAVGILTVQSQKPFNPILGETYQGCVDGCPLYIEQISHHPPISAYYMVGRGYKMYGCVEPRISLGFNAATGYSNLPHYIEYDDGTILELIFAKITITGMMFGDREFYFQDKSKFFHDVVYAFDKTNNLFTELVFGPFKSGGFFSSSSEPEDYFHGKIYEVTDNFKEQFNKSTPRIFPSKHDIIKEHMMFDGIWSASVHIDGEEIINFKTDLPYEFVEEEYPIPSDSRYRRDLQKLVQGDKEEAQRLKEEMEEAQRRDKKLRTKA